MQRFSHSRQELFPRLRHSLAWLLIVACLALLSLLATLFLFAHPALLDDYENITWTSFSTRQWELYRSWSGRYFTNAAASLSPLRSHSLAGFRAALFAFMLLFSLAFLSLVVGGLRRYSTASRSLAWALALSALVLFFGQIPSLTEGFFWYSSVVTYVVPCSFAFLLFRLLLGIQGQERLPAYAWLSLLFVVPVFGGNELLWVCFPILIVVWRGAVSGRTPRYTGFYRFLLVACILFGALALLAPGNFQRQSAHPFPGPGLLYLWLKQMLLTLYSWLRNPYLICYSILLVGLLAGSEIRLAWLRTWQALLLPAGIVAFMLLPAMLGLGEAPPLRVDNALFAFFLPAWLLFLLAAIRYARAVLLRHPAAGIFLKTGLSLVLLLSLFRMQTQPRDTSNFVSIIKCFERREPQHFNREWQLRYAQMKANPADTIFFKPLSAKACKLLYFVDITTWPSHSNRFFAQYWGKKMVFADTSKQHP